MTKRILTLQEVSERTRIPLATLRYYRATNAGPKLWKLGGRIVAYEDDVDAWIQEQYETTSTTREAVSR